MNDKEREALQEQAMQDLTDFHQSIEQPVAYVYEKNLDVFGVRKDVAFLKSVEVGTYLYAAPVHTKDLTDESAIRASEREAIKMDILFALEKDTGAWTPDKAYNDGFNYALDLVEQEIDKRNQMIFNTPIRTKDLTDEEAEFAFDRGGNELCLKLRAVIAADREKNK